MTSAAHKELTKLFGSVGDGQDDKQLEEMIRTTEAMMAVPARAILRDIGLLDPAATKPFALLDHACGIGPIAAQLQEALDAQVLAESRILCADFSENLVNQLKRRAVLKGWSNVEAASLDAQKSGLPDESFSHVSINFAMHIIPDPQAVLRDVMRILKPGGKLGLTTWHKDSAAWAPDMRSSFAALPFAAPFPDPLPMAPNGLAHWTEEDGMRKELADQGFVNVRTEKTTFAMPVQSAEEYVRMFDMMRQWILKTYWDEETQKKAEGGALDELMVKHLTEKHGGKGWELSWTFVVATGEKPAA